MEKGKFLEKIKFDPNGLLNPSVCNGENFFTNILIELGVSKDIVKNPDAIEILKESMIDILEQKRGIDILDFYENPTPEQIAEVIETINTSGILSNEERQTGYSSDSLYEPKDYIRLSVDRETGNVIIQHIDMSYRDAPIGSARFMQISISSNGDGNITRTTENSNINLRSKQENLDGNKTTIYNSNGIEMESLINIYKQKGENSILTRNFNSRRNSQYPFIAEFTDMISGSNKYYIINWKRLETLNLQSKKVQNSSGKDDIEYLIFDTLDDAIKYYKGNKKEIDEKLADYVSNRDNKILNGNYKLIKDGSEKLIKAGVERLLEDAGFISRSK